MEYLILVFLFILGLLVGSFLNVVILRFNTGLSIRKGRSKCFSCNKTLFWYELLPLVSFIFQKGKCRGCGSRISWQYPLVELTTAFALPAIFVLSPRALIDGFGFIVFLITSLVICFYIVMFVYDLRHKIIPDIFSYSTAILALFIVILNIFRTGFVDWQALIAGPVLFAFFYFFWFISRGRWMGLGDAKLALSIGWMLGLWGGIAAILLAFWLGAAFVLIVMFFQRVFLGRKGLGLKSEVPFGPFILIGFLLAFGFGINMQSILGFLAV